MGFFFKKRIKLFPGLYLNLSKDGFGFSTGVKGLRYSVNSKGEQYISGGREGMYFREKIKEDKTQKIEISNPKTQKDLEEDLDKSRLLRANAMRLIEKINAIKELENKAVISKQESDAIIDLIRRMN